MEEKNSFALQHWPALVMGCVVAVIFTAVLVAFTVKETEHAIKMRFGKAVKADYEPGLKLKWPYPIEDVWHHDKRQQCYELGKGHIEQCQTADEYQVVITTYVLWKVGDPLRFLEAVNTTAEAENKLNDVVRDGRKTVIGRHSLGELINTDPAKVRIADIEDEIKAAISPRADRYGIEVVKVGFKHIGFPAEVSEKVFERMKAERKRKSDKFRAEGKRDGQKIRDEADVKANEILTKAEAEAQSIRAEGDQVAAQSYAEFSRNPELAKFLRKLQSLRKTLAESEDMTLIIDTNTPPFDLLKPGATDLKVESTGNAQSGGGK